MPIKVGIYCRLSDEDRDKINKNDDSNSIVNQRSMCLKFANQNGWNVVDIYSDDDFSGAGTYRPDFERLIKDCENGKINLVLCKSQSRFSRDMEIVERYLHNKFIEWGIRFIGIIDNADTSIESNKKSRQINGLINEWYLDDLSTNIKKSLKNKREDGLFMGSFAPYGYIKDENDKHKLIVDPVAAEIVKKIFFMYVNGYGYYKICEYLNVNKVPTRAIYKKQKGSKFVCANCDLNTAKWSIDTIAQILRNEVYIGNLVQGKKTSLGYKVHKFKKVPEKDWCRIENTHEPIIDIETWNKVQKKLGTHEIPVKTGEIYYLSKKVYCSCCGKPFVRNVYNVKNEITGKREYMQCNGQKKYHICENKNAIRIDKLEEILLTIINNLIETYYDKEKFKKYFEIEGNYNNYNYRIDILQKEKNMLSKKIDKNKKYYKKLYEDKVNNIIDEEMFKTMSIDYLKDNKIMNKRIEHIDLEINNIIINAKNVQQVDQIINKYSHINNLNKVIVDEFFDKIYVGVYDKETKTRDIEILINTK